MKARNLIGLPVVDVSRGVRVGEVKDVLLNKELELKGLVVEGEGLESFLPLEAFEVGEDLVMMAGGLEDKAEGEYYDYHSRLGLLVIDEKGKELGIMSDLVLEAEGKRVMGLEISCGLVKDFVDGRSEIPKEKIKAIGEDLILIEAEGG